MTSMQPLSFSFLSEANSVGIRDSARSSMLTNFREHFKDRTETELNRQSSAGRNGDTSERASRTSRCLDLESTALHLLHTSEHVFRSWKPSFPNTPARHSSGNPNVRSASPPPTPRHLLLPLPTSTFTEISAEARAVQEEETCPISSAAPVVPCEKSKNK